MSDTQKTDSQVIFLVGPSYGGKHNDRRTVDSATAKKLVAAGVARYPDAKNK